MAEPFVRVTLDGPGKNALSTPLMTNLLEQVHAAGGAPLLLTGARGAFSAGLDLREVAGLDAESMVPFLDLLEDLVGALYHHPAPTVAHVNGHAIAGGAVLALCCDQRIATPGRARIGLNEVANGLQFPPRTLAIVTRQLPRPSWHRVLLGADLFTVDQALALGIVDALGEADAAEAAITGLAAHPAEAYAATKASLRPPTDVAPATREAFLRDVVPAWTAPAVKAKLLAILGG